MITNEIHKDVPKFECEICGLKLDIKRTNDLIIFAHGEIGNSTGKNHAFREIKQTIYIHKQCMKLLINNKFGKIVRKYFNDSI